MFFMAFFDIFSVLFRKLGLDVLGYQEATAHTKLKGTSAISSPSFSGRKMAVSSLVRRRNMSIDDIADINAMLYIFWATYLYTLSYYSL